MNRSRSAVVAASLAIASIAAGTGCKSKAQKAKEAAAAAPVVEGFKNELKAIHASLPETASLAEQACDDAAIQKALGGPHERPPAFVDDKFLVEMEGGPRRDFHDGRNPYDIFVSIYLQSFLRSTSAEHLDLAAAADDIKEDVVEGGNVLLVYRVAELVKPQVTKPTGALDQLLDRKAFEPGHFVGWVLVYALEGPTRLCQARFEATNSDSVKYEKNKIAQGLYEDFKDNIEKEAAASLKRISPRLRSGLY